GKHRSETGMLLYRGISVEFSKLFEVISKIKENGITGEEGFWHFQGWCLRNHISRLFQKHGLTIDDTRKGFHEFPVVAFADEIGAYYYALKHNYREGRAPLIIKAKIDVSTKYAYVDGRDFLYPVFQGWDQRNLAKQYGINGASKIVEKTLRQIYGAKIVKYFQKVTESEEQKYRIAMCDLATHDLDILSQHVNNRIVIEGRYGVIFRSAFFVAAPIKPDEIVEVFVPEQGELEFRPQLKLYEWL
ncbi:MAG: hypothetical protein QW279_15295, partial [Candidatus Jordarchaeaceae archaeon]